MFKKIKKSWIKFIFARKKIKELQKEKEFLQECHIAWVKTANISLQRYVDLAIKTKEI